MSSVRTPDENWTKNSLLLLPVRWSIQAGPDTPPQAVPRKRSKAINTLIDSNMRSGPGTLLSQPTMSKKYEKRAVSELSAHESIQIPPASSTKSGRNTWSVPKPSRRALNVVQAKHISTALVGTVPRLESTAFTLCAQLVMEYSW